MEGIDATVMAVRESLMQYFKGTCIQPMTQDTNVYLQNISGHRRYQYQREQLDRQNPCQVLLGGIDIFSVHRNPDTLKFEDTLNRSKQLQAVKEAIEDFMGKYLGSVKVEYGKNKVPKKLVDDKTLLKAKPRDFDKEKAAAEAHDKMYADLMAQQEAMLGSRPVRHMTVNSGNFATTQMMYYNGIQTQGTGVRPPMAPDPREVMWTTTSIETDYPDLTDVPF